MCSSDFHVPKPLSVSSLRVASPVIILSLLFTQFEIIIKLWNTHPFKVHLWIQNTSLNTHFKCLWVFFRKTNNKETIVLFFFSKNLQPNNNNNNMFKVIVMPSINERVINFSGFELKWICCLFNIAKWKTKIFCFSSIRKYAQIKITSILDILPWLFSQLYYAYSSHCFLPLLSYHVDIQIS